MLAIEQIFCFIKKVKGAKSASGVRTIPIPDVLMDDLRAALPASPDALLFTQSRTGRMHSRTSMRCMWTSFKRELDIRAGAVVYRNQIVTHAIADDLVPYCLRRAFFYLKRKTIGKTDGFWVKSVSLCEV